MGKSLCLQLWLSGTHIIDSNTAIILYLCLLHMQLQHSYKKLYLILDNGSLTFTGDPHEVLLHKTFSILVYNLPLPTLPSLPSPPLPSLSLPSPSLLSSSLPSPSLPSPPFSFSSFSFPSFSSFLLPSLLLFFFLLPFLLLFFLISLPFSLSHRVSPTWLTWVYSRIHLRVLQSSSTTQVRSTGTASESSCKTGQCSGSNILTGIYYHILEFTGGY